jgi:hypothetical protein
MGYRSEVDVVFYVPSESDTAYPLLKLWFDAHYPHTEAKDEWGAEIKYLQEDRAITVYYNCVKWYSAYEHPQRVDKAFDDIDKLVGDQSLTPVKEDDPDAVPFDIAWEFVRLGEEDDDIETRASENADFVIAINRSTEISFTPPTKEVTT